MALGDGSEGLELGEGREGLGEGRDGLALGEEGEGMALGEGGDGLDGDGIDGDDEDGIGICGARGVGSCTCAQPANRANAAATAASCGRRGRNAVWRMALSIIGLLSLRSPRCQVSPEAAPCRPATGARLRWRGRHRDSRRTCA